MSDGAIPKSRFFPARHLDIAQAGVVQVKISQHQANKLILAIGCAAFFAPVVLWPVSAA